MNNDYFEVERSRDAVDFKTVGRIKGCTTCMSLEQYALMDNKPYTGRSYYRLKQVDLDNKFSYSSLAAVHISNRSDASVQVYPTITQGAFQVRIHNVEHQKQVDIQWLNPQGSLLKQQVVWLNKGDNRINYSLSGLPNGTYYIRVVDKKTKHLPLFLS